METQRPTVGLLLLVLAAVTAAEAETRPFNTENILINVTAGRRSDAQLLEPKHLQIQLNISVGEQLVLVNGVPVRLSGVTRLNCPALLLDRPNGTGTSLQTGGSVSTVTRVMVSQNQLDSDSAQLVALQVFSEVIEVDGEEVQQQDMCEVKIVMSPDFQKVAQYSSIYPLGHSQIFRLPREQDVLVTDPPGPRRAEEQLVSHTTSQNLQQAETTQEEVAAPGKLPETPLRMDPELLYELRLRPDYDEQEPRDSDHVHMETPLTEQPPSPSSYSALCRWVDEARERLKLFSAESLPLFFLVMWVVVIGVVGSAVIVRILDLIFPACEHKNVLPPGLMAAAAAAAAPSADQEKQALLENVEVEEQEEKNP